MKPPGQKENDVNITIFIFKYKRICSISICKEIMIKLALAPNSAEIKNPAKEGFFVMAVKT